MEVVLTNKVYGLDGLGRNVDRNVQVEEYVALSTAVPLLHS